MSRRGYKALLLTLGALAGLLLVLAAAVLAGGSGAGGPLGQLLPGLNPAEFKGQVMDPSWAAEDFSLVDQRGDHFSLREARGKVVVLTFLYTSCTDVCPFIGAKLREASELLGPRSEDVELVVISTDPQRDSTQRRAGFSRSLGLFDRWHFLSGGERELQPVWDAYFIGPQQVEGHGEEVSDETLREYGLLDGLSDQSVGAAKQTIREYGGGYDVSHSAPVWLIDRTGTVRVLHGQDLLPSELVHDIHILLAE